MFHIKIEFHIYIHKENRQVELNTPVLPPPAAVAEEKPAKKKNTLWLSEYARREALYALKKGRFSTSRNYHTALRSFLRFREGRDIPMDKLTAPLLAVNDNAKVYQKIT